MQIFQSYYETLYQRPVVRLAGYSARHGLPASLYAYLAAGGPTNSAKDALAEGMLAIATEKGLLKPGQTVVEGSSGSFAVALAISSISLALARMLRSTTCRGSLVSELRYMKASK